MSESEPKRFSHSGKPLRGNGGKPSPGCNANHINWEEVDELIEAGCMGTEIAGFFNLSEGRFYQRVQQEHGVSWTEYKQKKQSSGEALIRLMQFKRAIGKTKKGDNTMLIWLGKVRLGQKEQQEHHLDPEFIEKFNAIMAQLLQSQVQRNTALSMDNNAAISE